ncbi:MAG: putative nuclease of putative toxin-antitoxin system [Candidatus Binatia bacterium]|jgi:predicted nuclease of predicted toxin-antitoxin system
MKFKIDQNLPEECREVLSDAGHDAMTVYDQELSGAPDDRIAEVCKAEDRVLITADLDFSDIRQYPPNESPGYIVLRFKHQIRPAQIALIRKLLTLFEKHPIAGRLWIVENDKVRIRGGTGT